MAILNLFYTSTDSKFKNLFSLVEQSTLKKLCIKRQEILYSKF